MSHLDHSTHSPLAISIVLPVFNGTRFLAQSLHSVISQSFQNWELLGVDDGSSDGSYELLSHYAASDSRIRLFRLPENRGPAAARNYALRQARGATIAYIDCDDEYYPDYLGHVFRWHSQADVLVFLYDAVD